MREMLKCPHRSFEQARELPSQCERKRRGLSRRAVGIAPNEKTTANASCCLRAVQSNASRKTGSTFPKRKRSFSPPIAGYVAGG